VLASHLHSSIIMHSTLEESLAFILANKLSSPTLLPTNVMQLILKSYKQDPVCLTSREPIWLPIWPRSYSGPKSFAWHGVSQFGRVRGVQGSPCISISKVGAAAGSGWVRDERCHVAGHGTECTAVHRVIVQDGVCRSIPPRHA
jgi:hypothetical protein